MPSKNPDPPLSVRLPRDLKRRLKQAAADAGVPVNAVICRAVQDRLDAIERQEISR
jgi:predicted HicB family RNase H-like nuclease